jgi:HD superfamily phosphodiesterase
MSDLPSALIIPDPLLAKEVTDLLREHSTDLLMDHSMRVYFFAAELGRQQKLCFDPELLYVAAAFHDFGLHKKFSSSDERFEVDGTNATRQFLATHKVPEEKIPARMGSHYSARRSRHHSVHAPRSRHHSCISLP